MSAFGPLIGPASEDRSDSGLSNIDAAARPSGPSSARPGRHRDDPRPGAASPAGPCVRRTDRAVRLTEDERHEEDAEMRYVPVLPAKIVRAPGVDVVEIDLGTA